MEQRGSFTHGILDEISLLSPSPGNLGWRVPVRGGVDNRSEARNHIDSQDVNATAIAIAINDSRVKSSVNINESYKILSVKPWHYETNDQMIKRWKPLS
jgi:hypothetical protein